jgi:hypothetical protein
VRSGEGALKIECAVYEMYIMKFIMSNSCYLMQQSLSQTPWLLVRKQTVLTEHPPQVGEFWCQLLWIEGCRSGTPTAVNLNFLDLSW